MTTHYLVDLLHSDKRWCIKCKNMNQINKLMCQWHKIKSHYNLRKKYPENTYDWSLEFDMRFWMPNRRFHALLKTKDFEDFTTDDWYPELFITGANFDLGNDNCHWMRYGRISYSNLNMSVKPRRKGNNYERKEIQSYRDVEKS